MKRYTSVTKFWLREANVPCKTKGSLIVALLHCDGQGAIRRAVGHVKPLTRRTLR